MARRDNKKQEQKKKNKPCRRESPTIIVIIPFEKASHFDRLSVAHWKRNPRLRGIRGETNYFPVTPTISRARFHKAEIVAEIQVTNEKSVFPWLSRNCRVSLAPLESEGG